MPENLYQAYLGIWHEHGDGDGWGYDIQWAEFCTVPSQSQSCANVLVYYRGGVPGGICPSDLEHSFWPGLSLAGRHQIGQALDQFLAQSSSTGA